MRHLILLASLFLIAGCQDDKHHGLIWKISKDSQIIYVQGVVHAGKLAHVTPSETTMKIFNSSNFVIAESIESNPKAEENMKSAELSEKNQILLEDLLKKLLADELLTNSDYKNILKYDVAYFDNVFAPAFSKKISQSNAFSRMFADYRIGMDSSLVNLATKQGKHISGLEQFYSQRLTWHKTCDVNNLFPLIIKSYESTIYDNKNYKAIFDLHESISKGNLELAQKLISEIESAIPHIKIHGHCSYKPRTKEWAENWDSVMRRAPNGLVLIGAYHVIQEPSLLTLLKERGYLIERF